VQLLGDLTVVEWHIRTEDPHGLLSDLHIDRTGAAHLSGGGGSSLHQRRKRGIST